MSTKDVLKKLEKRSKKATQTFSITEENLKRFKDLCKKKGWNPSNVVDLLIADFLEEAK